MKKKIFELIYDTEVLKHLKYIDRKYHSLIRKIVKKKLSYEPDKEVKNRKPLLRPSILGVTWELRCGPNNRFRIFYCSDRQLMKVYILAIGIKDINRLFINGKEIKL